MTSAHEIDAIVSILEPLSTIAWSFRNNSSNPYLQCSQNSPKASHPSRMRSSPSSSHLPFGHKDIREARQAVRLSHVSRRFRQVALEEHSLWTTMRSNASKDETETFLSRSGTVTDLHLFVHVAPQRKDIDKNVFMKTFGTTASRWKTLSLTEYVHGFEGRGKDSGYYGVSDQTYVDYLLEAVQQGPRCTTSSP